MKGKIFIFFLIMIASGGCSALKTNDGYSYYDHLEDRKQRIRDWSAAEKTMVQAGTLRNSEYWKLFFEKVLELRPDLDDYLFYANEMIKVSRIYEEGGITRQQFEDKHHQLETLLAQEERRRAALLSNEHLLVNYESALFMSYRSSLFRDYAVNLQKELSQTDTSLSPTRCDIFGDTIRCTGLSPVFP